jgi:hypothetical protein
MWRLLELLHGESEAEFGGDQGLEFRVDILVGEEGSSLIGGEVREVEFRGEDDLIGGGGIVAVVRVGVEVVSTYTRST